MSHLRVSRTSLLWAWLVLGVTVARAQDYSPPPPKPKPKNPVTKAREDLQSAQSRLAAANARLQTAQATLKQLNHDAPLRWKEVEKLHDSAPELVAAREAYDRSHKQLAGAKRPLLEALRDQPEYRQAVAEREALHAKLKALPVGSSHERNEILHQFALAQHHVRQLEKEAVKSDSEGSQLLDSAGQDETALQELIRKKEAVMEVDPALAAVRNGLARAKTEIEAAERNVADEAKTVAAAQKRLADLQAKLKKAKKRRR